MSSEISVIGYGLEQIANTGAQASVRNSDSWPGRGSSSASLCGLRRVRITVRIAQLVMTVTVMYPVPGGVSRLGPQLPPQPEHEREPRHAGERCGGDAKLGGGPIWPRPPPPSHLPLARHSATSAAGSAISYAEAPRSWPDRRSWNWR